MPTDRAVTQLHPPAPQPPPRIERRIARRPIPLLPQEPDEQPPLYPPAPTSMECIEEVPHAPEEHPDMPHCPLLQEPPAEQLPPLHVSEFPDSSTTVVMLFTRPNRPRFTLMASI